jgi:hypothetical protein
VILGAQGLIGCDGVMAEKSGNRRRALGIVRGAAAFICIGLDGRASHASAIAMQLSADFLRKLFV